MFIKKTKTMPFRNRIELNSFHRLINQQFGIDSMNINCYKSMRMVGAYHSHSFSTSNNNNEYDLVVVGSVCFSLF